MSLGRQAGLWVGVSQAGFHPQPAGAERPGQRAGSHQRGGNSESGGGFEQHVSI